MATQRGTCKPKFYHVKVGNVVRVTGKEGIALGGNSEVFGRILQEKVYTPKRLRQGSKHLVKQHENLLWQENSSDFFGREKNSQIIKSLASQRDRVCGSRKSQVTYDD